MSEIRRVAVVGAGLMGTATAQVTATAGHEVIVRELDGDDPVGHPGAVR